MPISDSNSTYGNDETSIADLVNGEGVQSALVVGTSAVEIKVGTFPLANRKLVTLFNNSNSTLYWGYTNSVTISTGTPIFKNQFSSWTVGEDRPLYIIAGNANNDTRITEAS